MAIAPLTEGAARGGDPRRGLRLVQGGRSASATPRGSARHARRDTSVGPTELEELRRARAAHPTALAGVPSPGLTRTAPAPSARTSTRPSSRPSATQVRRRRAGVVVVLVAIALLALPLRGLGAVTVDGRATPGGVPAGLAPGSVYVVQPGDTLASIADQVNPGSVATVARELALSTGSATVVPGEHVRIP